MKSRAYYFLFSLPVRQAGIFYLLTSTFSLLTSSCSAPVGEHHPEWKKHFDDFNLIGCIAIYDLKKSKFIDYNPDRCAQRFIPASTFKICNSVIALETKTIPDTGFILKWDHLERSIPSWNRDQSMNEAFHNSAVWYYQEVARRIGKEKYQQYLNRFHYGNRNTGGAIDSFWLNGDLRISADEQVEFLKNLRTHQLPISKRTLELVKEMMVMEKNEHHTLCGKTGWAQMGGNDLGWFVGWVEKGDNAYFFAMNYEAPLNSTYDFGEARKLIAEKCLKELGVLH